MLVWRIYSAFMVFSFSVRMKLTLKYCVCIVKHIFPYLYSFVYYL